MEPRSLALVPAEIDPVVPSHQEELFEEISNILSKNPRERKHCVKLLKYAYHEHEEDLQRLAENPEKMASMVNRLTELMQSVSHQLPPLKKLTPYAAMSFITAAGAESLRIVSGTAPGGLDLCNGFTNCIKGYLVNANEEVVAAFSAFLNLAGKVNLGAVWAFNNAMTVESVGALVKDILIQNATTVVGNLADCPASYDFQNINAGSQVSKLSTQDCPLYQNAFKAKAQRDLADGTVNGLSTAVSFIILLGICLCACIFFGIRFLCKSKIS